MSNLQEAGKKWHIMNVFEDRVECSCGKVMTARSKERLGRKVQRHGKNNSPAMAISRIGCSDVCLHEYMIREVSISFHDMDCPNHQEKRNTNA